MTDATPEQQMVRQQLFHFQKDAELKRTITLLEHYASEARKAMALSEAAMMASASASPLVTANANGQAVGGDLRTQAAQEANGMANVVKMAMHNLRVASRDFVAFFEKPAPAASKLVAG